MPILVLVLFLGALAADITADTSQQLTQERAQANARSLGASMLTVRNALEAYMSAHPSASGSVAMSALGLPSWMILDPRIQVQIYSGRGFVYLVPADFPLSGRPGLTRLFSTDGAAGLAGIAHHQLLVTGAMGASLSLPASIPENSIVLAQ